MLKDGMARLWMVTDNENDVGDSTKSVGEVFYGVKHLREREEMET